MCPSAPDLARLAALASVCLWVAERARRVASRVRLQRGRLLDQRVRVCGRVARSRTQEMLGGVHICLCIAVTTLVHIQRLQPADLVLPLPAHWLVLKPWWLVGTFCLSDGLTMGFLLRVHTVSCISHRLEHACGLATGSAVSHPAVRLNGRALYAGCLLVAA